MTIQAKCAICGQEFTHDTQNTHLERMTFPDGSEFPEQGVICLPCHVEQNIDSKDDLPMAHESSCHHAYPSIDLPL